MSRRTFLIDGHSLLHRAFYALPPLTNASGDYTNAVYGFTLMLVRLLEEEQPDSIFVAFDVAAPTFRHAMYADYKGTRKKMPDELRPQVALLKEFLDAMGIPRLELEGYEADDVIGTAARIAASDGAEVTIVTGDRDALQLVSPHTRVMLTRKGIKETEMVDVDALKKDYRLDPEQVPELKSLMGDSSDNIPGVPGVGEKTAMKLLDQYGNLDGVYSHIEELKGKLKERLLDNREQAYLSLKLAAIDCSIPLDFDPIRPIKPVMDDLRAIINRLEFRTIAAKIFALLAEDDPDAKESLARSQTGTDYQWQRVNENNYEDFLALLRDSNCVYAAAELVGDMPACRMESVLLGTDSDDSLWLLDKDSPNAAWSDLRQQNERTPKVICPDAKQWYRGGVSGHPLTVALDGVLASYVLDAHAPTDLASLAQRVAGISYDEQKNGTLLLAEQIGCLRQLREPLEKELQAANVWQLYHDIELPLAQILSQMEHHGILVDPEALETLSQRFERRLETLTEEIHTIAGENFNINSPKQLGVILFERLDLPVIKRTKTGPSTSAEVLEELSDHPIVEKILEYRHLAKLKSTYADALGQLVHPETGRIHTTFNQTVTATGRLSSTNPNLQNIPIRTELGRDIRGAFVAPKGWYLLAADYSQIELRVLAHIAQDAKMMQAFREQLDIHTQTAAEVLGISIDEVSKEQRSAAKAVNFGIVYGISAFGLARNIKISQHKAQEYIDRYFARYPKIKEYMDNTVSQARRDGYVETMFHRRRYLPEIKARNFSQRSFAERTAMNSPIQGSAADIIKVAMIRVQKRIEAEKLHAVMLLQVHDELVLETPPEEVDTCARLLHEEMIQAIELSVPLEVDVQKGFNWKDMDSIG